MELYAHGDFGRRGISRAFIWLVLLYHRKPQLPQRIADSLGSFYQAVVNKYYIDELYAALFVKPLIDGSTRILWQGVDRNVIDAAVNDSADGARACFRRSAPHAVRQPALVCGWIAVGAAVVIAYMVWMGVR